MARFFINRPIVAIVIAIVMVIVGVVALLGLPISQYPRSPPESSSTPPTWAPMRRR